MRIKSRGISGGNGRPSGLVEWLFGNCCLVIVQLMGYVVDVDFDSGGLLI